MKKVIGWPLFGLSTYLLITRLWELSAFFFDGFGFWVGLINFTLLPITYFVYPVLRLIYAGTWEDIIYNLILLGFFFFSVKLLSRNVKRIPKQLVVSTEESEIPHLTRFEILKSLFSVPFSYYVLIFGIGLTTTIGILLIVTIYYVEASITGSVHTGILFLIGIGVLYGFLAGVYSIYISLKKPKNFEVAFLLKDEGSPLFGIVDEVASKVGTKVPDNILISFNPDFHVHQVETKLMDGTKINGRTLTLGLVYLKYLEENEIKSVIAHELAHFKGNDTLFSLYVSPAYKSFKSMLSNLLSITGSSDQKSSKGSTSRGAIALPNLLTMWIFSTYFLSLKKMYSSLDRVREARADIIASSIYGSNTFASALTKVSQIGPIFGQASQTHFVNLIKAENKVFSNYYEYFNENVLSKAEVKKLMENISDSDSVTSELDTHFSLQARLAYLPGENDKEVVKGKALTETQLLAYEVKLTEFYGMYIGLLMGAIK